MTTMTKTDMIVESFNELGNDISFRECQAHVKKKYKTDLNNALFYQIRAKLEKGRAKERSRQEATQEATQPASPELVVSIEKMRDDKKPDQIATQTSYGNRGDLNCDSCGQPLGIDGGFAGSGLCGPCCTGEAETASEFGETW